MVLMSSPKSVIQRGIHGLLNILVLDKKVVALNLIEFLVVLIRTHNPSPTVRSFPFCPDPYKLNCLIPGTSVRG